MSPKQAQDSRLSTKSPLKVALVCDWLTNMRGGERVVLAVHDLYPDAPLYTSVYDRQRVPQFNDVDVRTTWLQNVPLSKRKHQLFPVLRARAFASFNFNEYDVVISMTSSDAKFIRVDPKRTLHLCYCFTPTRYYWSHYEEYRRNPGLGKMSAVVKPVIPPFVRMMRRKDYEAAQRVGVFIGDSSSVSARIKQYYDRDSLTLFPPVEFERFALGTKKRSGLLIAGQQVGYKRFDLAVEAANALNVPLTVIGVGSENARLRAMAGPTVTFMQANDKQLADAYASAELLLFPGEEDAGIVPLEAMACGTPVVAFGKGGALDSIIDGQTGILFTPQTVDALSAAIEKARSHHWNHRAIRDHAQLFSQHEFLRKLDAIVDSEYQKFRRSQS